MAADPIVGAWRLNVAKSKFGGPFRPRKELTVVYQERAGQLVGKVTGISEDGSPVVFKYTVPSSGLRFDAQFLLDAQAWRIGTFQERKAPKSKMRLDWSQPQAA
jgi:hypothetical protein